MAIDPVYARILENKARKNRDGEANYKMITKLNLFQIKERKIKTLARAYDISEDTARDIVNIVWEKNDG